MAAFSMIVVGSTDCRVVPIAIGTLEMTKGIDWHWGGDKSLTHCDHKDGGFNEHLDMDISCFVTISLKDSLIQS
jgi:hypothetical protein